MIIFMTIFMTILILAFGQIDEPVEINRITYYNATESQCDDSPLITASNKKIDIEGLKDGSVRWCALSRNLLSRWGGPYNYGDKIIIYSSDPEVRGIWFVEDTMNSRYRNTLDILVYGRPKFGKTDGKISPYTISNFLHYSIYSLTI